jgi:hypothetical protein
MHEIRSQAEFDGLKAAKAGVIVNVDKNQGTATAHKPWCAHPSRADFESKVIENRGRTGTYYYFLRQADAKAALGATTCAKCRGR